MFKVEEIKQPRNTLVSIQHYLAECSSVVRDKEIKSAEKLFNRLLTESYGNKASRVFEYIPVKVSLDKVWDYQHPQLFGFYDMEQKYYYTTARELLNWGWTVEQMLEVVDFTNYKVFKCETPYFLYGQISTHNQLTTVSHSQRYAECNRGYWCPPEYVNLLVRDKKLIQDAWNAIVTIHSPDELQNYMKNVLNIKRKEVFSRGSDMLQNRVFTIGGYTNNPNAWSHFINQRLDKHTQLETRVFTQKIKELIDAKSK